MVCWCGGRACGVWVWGFTPRKLAACGAASYGIAASEAGCLSRYCCVATAAHVLLLRLGCAGEVVARLATMHVVRVWVYVVISDGQLGRTCCRVVALQRMAVAFACVGTVAPTYCACWLLPHVMCITSTRAGGGAFVWGAAALVRVIGAAMGQGGSCRICE